MSTHFRPRVPTTTASSPVRPSTARSTVRAVTPSPPLSLNEALRLDSSTPGRPKSEGFVRTQDGSFVDHAGNGAHDLESFVKHMITAHTNNFSNSPTDTPGTVLRRGGATSGRSSPVKSRSRSQSPIKRPFHTPTGLLSHEEVPANDSETTLEQNEEGGNEEMNNEDEDEGEEAECPDTPTPVSRTQKRQAYVPLGTPPPFFKGEQKDAIETAHARSRSSNGMLYTPRAYAPTLAIPRSPTFVYQPQPPSPQHPAHRAPQSPSHITPPKATQQPHVVLRKPVPSNDPTRHISTSGQSNMSGGTAASKRSIFSTPGRDELERKKALVEPDQGPFARATSIQDLTERRRRISGKMSDEEGSERGDNAGRDRRGCGIGLRCNVM